MTVEEATADAYPSQGITIIKTAEDLQNIKNNLSGTYVLANEIDLTGVDWESIGDSTNKFRGKLYGMGHKITGLTINSTSAYTGLFGYTLGATIRDLQIDGANVTSTKEYTGTLVGYASAGTIDNIAITNTTVNGKSNTGGLAGYCYINSKITNSYVTGSVTGTNYTGGILGYCNNGTISSSYSAADVEGTNYVGGCVGRLSNSSKLLNTYSLGSVSGISRIGGLVGDIYGTSSSSNLQISNCYANGEVERTSGTATTFGNLYGYTDNASRMTVANNYAIKQDGDYFKTTQVGTTILDELTSDQMASLNTATGYAPADQWNMTTPRPTLTQNSEATHTSGGVNKDLISQPITYISSAEDLANIKNNLNETYILISDIDLTGINWESVGNNRNKFTGKLYGCGHKITGLTINSSSQYTGLFAYTQNATIKDLQIDGANVTSTGKYTGTLVGYAYKGTTIDNVAITNTTVNGKSNTGGLVGLCDNGTITNSYSNVNVEGTSNVGGCVGELVNSSKLLNSYSTGSVSGTAQTGGLAGSCYMGTITNSYSKADVKGTSSVGGCVGCLRQSSKLLNSYSTGSVSGTAQTGGLVGYITANLSSYTVQISNCYANGEVIRSSGTATTFGNLYGDTYNASYTAVANNYAIKQEGEYVKTAQEGTTILDELTSDKMTSLKTATGDAPADQWDMTLDRPQLKTNKEHDLTPTTIRLQIGEYGDENNVIYVETGFYMDNFIIDFSSPEKTEMFLDKVDTLMNDLNNKQSEFGVAQNRLKSVLQGLTTREENATAAKSTITDCDIAEESSNYVQQQILQQTSSALLVQANTLPQIALMLINGE